MSARPSGGAAQPSPPPAGVRALIVMLVLLGVSAIVSYALHANALGDLRWPGSDDAGSEIVVPTGPGLEVVYRASDASGKAPEASRLERAARLVERRAKALGISAASARTDGNDRVVLWLPGSGSYKKELELIAGTGQLRFFFDNETSRPIGPVRTRSVALKELAHLSDAKAQMPLLRKSGISPGFLLVEAPKGQLDDKRAWWFVYRLPPAMDAGGVSAAHAGKTESGGPSVTIEFTKEGSARFQEITRELYRRGVERQDAQTFAIVLDNVMKSDPWIDYKDADLAAGISGNAVISGGDWTAQEAKDLAWVLDAGALPVTLTLVAAERR